MTKKIESSNEITAKFKEWLERGLKKEGWSTRELARRCGMSDAHIINAKKGQRTVTYNLVASIAAAFEQRDEEAFREVGLLPNHQTKVEELQEILNYLPEDQQDEVIRYAEWKRKEYA